MRIGQALSRWQGPAEQLVIAPPLEEVLGTGARASQHCRTTPQPRVATRPTVGRGPLFPPPATETHSPNSLVHTGPSRADRRRTRRVSNAGAATRSITGRSLTTRHNTSPSLRVTSALSNDSDCVVPTISTGGWRASNAVFTSAKKSMLATGWNEKLAGVVPVVTLSEKSASSAMCLFSEHATSEPPS